MLDGFPESHSHLLRDDVKAFAFLATEMADGSPQVTPVWFDLEGDHFELSFGLVVEVEF